MIDLNSFLMNLINSNPNITNNPRAQELLQVIRSNDSVKGQQIADNLCASFNMTREQMLEAAKKKFRL